MANSPYINQPLWVVSGVAMAAESVENFTVTVGIVDYNISLTFDWDAGEDNDCIFTGWELQLRAEDSDWEDMHHCTDARKEDVNCTLTEGRTVYFNELKSHILCVGSNSAIVSPLDLPVTFRHHPGWRPALVVLPRQPLGTCPRSPGAGTEQQCLIYTGALLPEQHYWMRVQEICGAVSPPFEPSTLTECNTTCGAGTQDQSWSCPSGSATDCGPEPETSQVACYETAGCVWLASDWGDCSSRCGHGTRTRNVSCSGPLEDDVGSSLQIVGEHVQTLAKFAKIYRSAIGRPVSGVLAALSAAVASEFDRSHVLQAWRLRGRIKRVGESSKVTDWSSCNVTCGSGFQEREALCPASTCVGDLPATLQSCVGRSECTWQDCVADQPANITTCDLQVCMEVTEESASFDLVLEVDSETNVEGVKESLQEAVAESLNVDVEAVSVEIADGRRLASTRSLQFLVQVRDVTKGLSEFLSSESSLGAVAQDVVKELEATGINAAVQISVGA
eukprot:g27883.t1